MGETGLAKEPRNRAQNRSRFSLEDLERQDGLPVQVLTRCPAHWYILFPAPLLNAGETIQREAH
jgi:hypothetical protein